MEIWKPVVGYEGLYEVSSEGRVKRVARVQPWGKSTRRVDEKIIKSCNYNGDYKALHLSKDGKKSNKKVYRLVAEAFIPNPENRQTVNHKNGIHYDDRVDNLEWATFKENNDHKIHVLKRPGPNTGKFGAEHGRSIAVNQYTLDGELVATYGGISEASRITGIGTSKISFCCRTAAGMPCSRKQLSAGRYKWRYATGADGG
jgi:hypothetical protein